jgi:hypothetical protein
MLAVMAVLLAIVAVLFIDPSAADEPASEDRLSWQEQLANVQSLVAETDPDATLGTLFGSMFYDEENSLGRNKQADPLPVTSVLFRFYGKQPHKIYTLHYYDVMTNTLILDKDVSAPPPDDDRVPLTQLSTLVRVGPFDVCQSTLPTVQQLMHAEIVKMHCSALFTQGLYAKDKLGVPTTWYVTWTSYEARKKSQQVEIWIDAATGEQLKIEADVRKES